MISLKRFLVVFVVLIWGGSVCALELRGTTSVNVTSDTSVNAKNIAFDDATRQIFVDSLRQYVNADTLDSIVKNATKAELSNMILSSSIDGEQTSDTTYSANITMTIDTDAVRVWLDEKEVQHWLPNTSEQNVFSVVVTLSNKLADWGQLNQIANNEKIDLGTQNIHGNMVTLRLPSSVRGAFTIAVRGAGWKYADKDGVLHIWK